MSLSLTSFPLIVPGSCSFPFLSFHFVFHTIWMTLAWILCILFNNGSMVDFGWPSGFFIMALSYWFNSSTDDTDTDTDIPSIRRLAITLPYVICGARFMFGWIASRKHYRYEDARWNVWRQRWRDGKGWFGIRSVPLNFFFFYHAQGLANSLVMSLPLHFIHCSTLPSARSPSLSTIEIIAILTWVVFFTFENIADLQLASWKKRAARAARTAASSSSPVPAEYVVCREGLWKYSRHPNYFGEWMLWVSYAVLASQSIEGELWQWIGLGFGPVLAYWFLIEFTGVFMAEQASLKKRGEVYRNYINEVNMVVPWFSRGGRSGSKKE